MNKIFKQIVIKEIVLRRATSQSNKFNIRNIVQITLNINKNKNMPTLNYLFIHW